MPDMGQSWTKASPRCGEVFPVCSRLYQSKVAGQLMNQGEGHEFTHWCLWRHPSKGRAATPFQKEFGSTESKMEQKCMIPTFLFMFNSQQA